MVDHPGDPLRSPWKLLVSELWELLPRAETAELNQLMGVLVVGRATANDGPRAVLGFRVVRKCQFNESTVKI